MKKAAMRLGALVAVLTGLVSFRPSPSLPMVKVGEFSFDWLVGKSDRIVLAKVDRIEVPEPTKEPKETEGLKLAHATVLETWKGRADEPLVYRCSKSWTCDITDATVGEVVVLFLDSTSEPGTCMVTDSGRGRLPITESNGEKYATLWTHDIHLPLDTEILPGPEASLTFIQNVKLDTVRSLTKAMVARHAKLDEMVERSDAIVVATIARVRFGDHLSRVEWFSLDVEETWKGDIKDEKVDFRPPPSWPTDLIPMKTGQRAVFLLTKLRSDRRRDLVEDGRGRMVLERIGQGETASLWIRDVETPKELPVVETSDKHAPNERTWGRVDAAALKQFVTRAR